MRVWVRCQVSIGENSHLKNQICADERGLKQIVQDVVLVYHKLGGWFHTLWTQIGHLGLNAVTTIASLSVTLKLYTRGYWISLENWSVGCKTQDPNLIEIGHK